MTPTTTVDPAGTVGSGRHQRRRHDGQRRAQPAPAAAAPPEARAVLPRAAGGRRGRQRDGWQRPGGTGGSAPGGRGGATGAAGLGGRGGATGGAGAGGTGPGGSGGSGPATGLLAAGVRWFGRVDVANPAQPRFSWSGTGFAARFSGTALAASLNNSGAFIFKAVVDGAARPTFTTTSGTASYNLATGLAAGEHIVALYRQTEGGQGDSRLMSLTVTGGALMEPPAGPGKLIEVIGDSISVGYGTLGTTNDAECFATESHWDAFPSYAARALGAEVSTIGASGRGVFRNYGGDMTDTMPKVYDRTLLSSATPAWPFQIQPQVVVINLGTNDISNNKGDPGTPFRDAYTGLLQNVRGRIPARTSSAPTARCSAGPSYRRSRATSARSSRPATRRATRASPTSKASSPRPATRPPASTTPTPPSRSWWEICWPPRSAPSSAGDRLVDFAA